jgi:hypothetical protein
MKLAEALLLRAEYNEKISSLQNRIFQNLKVQEDEKPFENPQDLLDEILEANDNLCELIKKINARNNIVKLPDGRILSDALTERDMLMKKRELLSNIVLNALHRDHRLARAEIKMKVTVSVEDIQKQADDISKKFRELDTLIQGLNWTVDL